MMNRRPVTVTILAVVLMLSGAAGLGFHIGDFSRTHALEYTLVSAVRGLAIVAGVFLLRGKNWARWLAMSWIAFHVAISFFHPLSQLAIHVVVFAVFAFVLFRRAASEYFRGAPGVESA